MAAAPEILNAVDFFDPPATAAEAFLTAFIMFLVLADLAEVLGTPCRFCREALLDLYCTTASAGATACGMLVTLAEFTEVPMLVLFPIGPVFCF